MQKAAHRAFAMSEVRHDVSSEEASGVRPASRVRFVESERPSVSVLEVLVPSAWDVIADLYRTLYDLRVQVIHASARHHGTAVRYRVHLVEFDGAALHKRRHYELAAAVDARLEVLEAEVAPARSVVRTRGVRAAEESSATVNDDVA